METDLDTEAETVLDSVTTADGETEGVSICETVKEVEHDADMRDSETEVPVALRVGVGLRCKEGV
jgi:hypothetical protein